MFRTIMVPLDRTRFAEAALPPAMHFARRHRAALELVTVSRPLPPLDYMSTSVNELLELEQEGREDDRRYMLTVADKVQEAVGAEVAVRHLIGQPAHELAARARTGGIDLVVMSTHAHGPITRAFVGSVSDRMVRSGSVPLMLIRPGDAAPAVELVPSRPFRRILVPLDGSALAESALDPSLLDCLEPNASEVTLLHVTGFPTSSSIAEAALVMEPGTLMLNDDSSEAEAYLASLAGRIAPSWGCRVSPRLVVGASTGAAIVDFAQANGNDMIAMATHGRGGAARLILGSVADTVARTSPVPTLLFPAAHSNKGSARSTATLSEVEL